MGGTLFKGIWWDLFLFILKWHCHSNIQYSLSSTFIAVLGEKKKNNPPLAVGQNLWGAAWMLVWKHLYDFWMRNDRRRWCRNLTVHSWMCGHGEHGTLEGVWVCFFFFKLCNALNHIFKKINCGGRMWGKRLGIISDFCVNSCSSNCFACELRVYSILLLETISWWKHLDVMWF